MYARPKKKLRETNGSGVILEVEWFENDPTGDDDARPFLLDQLMIPAPNAKAVSDEMIEDAIAERLPQVERERRPSDEPMVKARALLGKAHDARAMSDRAIERRNERAAARE